MSEAIITSLITGCLALIGVWVSNRKSASLLEYRLQQLEDKVDKHNHVIERVYNLEAKADVYEEKFKELEKHI